MNTNIYVNTVIRVTEKIQKCVQNSKNIYVELYCVVYRRKKRLKFSSFSLYCLLTKDFLTNVLPYPKSVPKVSLQYLSTSCIFLQITL